MKRYDICADYSQTYAEECDDGEWVKADVAVELLDALESLLDSLGALTNKSELHGWMNEEDQEKIWSTIAKAKGEC